MHSLEILDMKQDLSFFSEVGQTISKGPCCHQSYRKALGPSEMRKEPGVAGLIEPPMPWFFSCQLTYYLESMVSGHFQSCLGGLALELGSVNTQVSDSEVIIVMSQRKSGSSSLPSSTSGERTKASSHLGC